MKRQVLWSESALAEFEESIAYIAERNPIAARKVHAEIDRAGRRLADAATGRAGRVEGTYEKVVAGRPYILAYGLFSFLKKGEVVVILRVIHTSRHWPEDQWPE